MASLVPFLSNSFFKELKLADEIWISVALINKPGFAQIIANLREGCIQHYVIGIDLPSDPSALTQIDNMKNRHIVHARVYMGNEYFHPKMYLIRKGEDYKGYVGSANCTNGGFAKNIELTICCEEQELCLSMLDNFNKLFENSQELDSDLIEEYRKSYLKRRKKHKEDQKLLKEQKQKIVAIKKSAITDKKLIIRTLKKYRDKNNYDDVVKERADIIRRLKKTLDYPNFNNINIDDFFAIQELGHLISIPKPAIKRRLSTFSNLLKMLCNDEKDLVERYSMALNGPLKIEGVSEALISKILVIHNPRIYFIKNKRSNNALSSLGINYKRGVPKAVKYKIMSDLLVEICREANIKNLAVLDYFLYLEDKTNKK